MRPGTESEPLIDWRESLRGLGLMILSDGLPRNEAAVMLMSDWEFMVRRELLGEK